MDAALALEAEGLSERWAPIFLQHTSREHPERDRPLRVDFDGDWDATNDWAHLDASAAVAPPVAYASQILTKTHAFLTFTLFYPRDWATPFCVPYVCHDNDLEVTLLVIDRAHGADAAGLVYVETKTHARYLGTRGSEVARGADGRPILEVESEGHGMRAVRAGDATDGQPRAYVARGAEPLVGIRPREQYELVSLRETLWAHRHARSDAARLWSHEDSGVLHYRGERFGRLGAPIGILMAGSVYPGGVRPPWALQSGGGRGDWFLDPALAARLEHAAWFPAERPLDAEYVLNRYVLDLATECEGARCEAGPPLQAGLTSRPAALVLALGLGLGASLVRRRAVRAPAPAVPRKR